MRVMLCDKNATCLDFAAQISDLLFKLRGKPSMLRAFLAVCVLICFGQVEANQYLIHQNSGVPGENTKILNGVDDPDACQAACTMESAFVCRSADFSKSQKVCILSTFSLVESGGLGLRTDYPGNPWDHFERAYLPIPNAGLPGHNDRILHDQTVSECEKACSNNETFYCRSFDFKSTSIGTPQKGTCYLSRKSARQVPLKTDYPGNPFVHYERQRVFNFIDENSQSGTHSSFGKPEGWITQASEKWMSYLPDDIKLSDISIPGTHDSATSDYRGGVVGVVTQDWSVKEQLNAGIRHLDLRLRAEIRNNKWVFDLQHGNYYLGITLDDVLKDVGEFLSANPTETILFNWQYQGRDTHKGAREVVWRQYLLNYPWLRMENSWVKDSIGIASSYQRMDGVTLGQVRGLMVNFLHEFHTTTTSNTNGNVSKTITYRVKNDYYQNCYQVYNLQTEPLGGCDGRNTARKVSLNRKVRLVEELLQKTSESPRNTWAFNALSGSTGLIPRTVSNRTNPAAYDKLAKVCGVNPSRVGLIWMDYPGEKLIYRIIKCNFGR